MPMPSRLASSGEWIWTGFPKSSTSPRSARYTPARTFIRLVLPAPFSPSSAWISPRSTSSEAPAIATTSPKRFSILRSATAGGFTKSEALVGERAVVVPGALLRTSRVELFPHPRGFFGGKRVQTAGVAAGGGQGAQLDV